MVSVKDFCEKAELKQLTNLEETAEITDGYICDLLSWVMAGEPRAWPGSPCRRISTFWRWPVCMIFSCVVIRKLSRFRKRP